MGFGGGSYSGPREVSYLFVDGGYLRKVFEKFGAEYFDGAELPIDYRALGRGFTKCFYYDCLPAPRAQEVSGASAARLSRQQAELGAIRALRGWHVIEGVMAGSGGRARQKQVDVQIAVDMLTHSYRRNMHRADFIAGDQDFKPLIEAVVREGMFVEIWFEKSSASVDLLDVADGRKPLDLYTVHGYLTKPFQETHPLPRRWSARERDVGTARLQQTGECAQGPLELYSGDSGYMILRRSYEPEDHFSYMTHPKLDFLKRVVASMDGEITWHQSPLGAEDDRMVFTNSAS